MNEKFMKEKPVFPLIMSMATPMVISMLVNSLYNIVDSFFVAKIGEDAITALSLVSPLTEAGMFGCSQLSSECEEFAAYNTDSSSSTGSSSDDGNGIIAAAVSIPIMRPFLKMFTQSENVISLGVRYSTIVFSFSIVIMISLAYEKIFQAVGRMNASLLSGLFFPQSISVFFPMHIFIGYSKKALHASVQSFFEQLFKIKYQSTIPSLKLSVSP